MPTDVCQKCQQSHPGRPCAYEDKCDGVETADVSEAAKEVNQKEANQKDKNKGESE
jgi:hypothetical protein